MVKTYEEYMKLLESAIIANGKNVLPSSEVASFIRKNNLDKDWQITPKEVVTDMATIIRRYSKPAIRKPISNPSVQRPNTKRIKTYSEYLKKLEEFIKLCGGGILSDKQIEEFIKHNNLDKEWGVNSGEVRIDMNAILNAHSKRQTTSSTVNATSVNDASRNMNRGDSATYNWTQEDEQIALCITEGIRRYPGITENEERLRNMLSDILPGKKLEINVLSLLVKLGILTQIKMENMDGLLKSKYISRLEGEYGTSRIIAERMVMIWFHSYGKNILSKSVR